MTSPASTLVQQLFKPGVTLYPEGDKLRFRGPARVLTEEVRQTMLAQKPELLKVLAAKAQNGVSAKNEVTGCSPFIPIASSEDLSIEALELEGELTYLFDERAAILEFDAGMTRREAEYFALLEVQATDAYAAWQRIKRG